jgi:hypothetical protein
MKSIYIALFGSTFSNQSALERVRHRKGKRIFEIQEIRRLSEDFDKKFFDNRPK